MKHPAAIERAAEKIRQQANAQQVCRLTVDEMADIIAAETHLAELVEACEAFALWMSSEKLKEKYDFYDRMNLCDYAEFLNRKALAKVRGEEFDETWEGVPQILIDLRTLMPHLVRERGTPTTMAKLEGAES